MPEHKTKTPVSKQRLIDDLIKIGVTDGDHLGMGLSFKSIGWVLGGPRTIIEALLEVIGPNGTLMMNAYTEHFNLTEARMGWTDYIFDFRSSKVSTGIVPETFRNWNGAIRSKHPTNSNVALGKYAKFLIDEHDENAAGYLPYEKLTEINGKYLAIGIGDRLVGFRHLAQQKAGLLDVVTKKRAVRFVNPQGRIETFIWRDRGGCPTKLADLVPILRREGLVADGTIGNASAVLAPMKATLDRMTSLLKHHPVLNLCDRPLCYWCRELERRMNLYPDIKNPKSFQKNKLLICLLAIANRLRETENPLVAGIELKINKLMKRISITNKN